MGLKDDVLELESRRDIFEHISKFPGCYMREVQKVLDMPTGQLEYHLNYMERKGLISGELTGNKKRYYVDDEVNYPDRKILGILRQDIPRKIILILLKGGECGFSEIANEFDVSKSTVSFHLKKMKDRGIIVSRKEGRRKIYSCKDDEKIAQVLITYKSSFLDDAVDRFVETWSELR